MKVARKQVYLGDLLELVFETDDDEYNVNFRGQGYGVSCNASGKTVFLLEWKEPDIEIDKRHFKKECNLFKRWTGGYGVDMAKRSKTSVEPRHQIGHAVSIAYRSDKFGSARNYRHKYKPGNCAVFASSLGDMPSVFAIQQTSKKRIVNATGLIG